MIWIVFLFILITVSAAAKSRNDEDKSVCALEGPENGLYKLARKNMYLRIIINKYDFRPYLKSSKSRKRKKDPPSIDVDEDYRDATLDKNFKIKYEKTRTISFYKIVIKVDMYPEVLFEPEDRKEMSFFDLETTNYIFKDSKKKTKITSFDRAHTLESKAILTIKKNGKEKEELNIEFILGPKKQKIRYASRYYYKNETNVRKKDAFLMTPSLELGLTEPISYQVFMYLDNGKKIDKDYRVKGNNNVNKLLKNIIEASASKDADGTFEISTDERLINHYDGAFCKFLKPWIKVKDSKTVQVDFHSAVEAIVKYPERFLIQSISHGKGFGNGFNDFYFSPGRIRANKTASSFTKNLFKKTFRKFLKDMNEKRYLDGTVDETKFLDNIHRNFLTLMKESFKEHRKAKKINSKFHPYEHHFDTSMKQVLKTGEDIVDVVNTTSYEGYIKKCYVMIKYITQSQDC